MSESSAEIHPFSAADHDLASTTEEVEREASSGTRTSDLQPTYTQCSRSAFHTGK